MELSTRFDSRKSFYGKATVEFVGGWGQFAELHSYGVHVATAGEWENPNTGEVLRVVVLHADWDYSPTTLRHVKEFIGQFGGDHAMPCRLSKAQLTKALELSWRFSGDPVEVDGWHIVNPY